MALRRFSTIARTVGVLRAPQITDYVVRRELGERAADPQHQRRVRRHRRLAAEQEIHRHETDDGDDQRHPEEREEDGKTTTSHRAPALRVRLDPPRSEYSPSVMETLLQDIRYACSMMRRNRSFTTAGLLTLALGIGATSAVFSVVYGVLLRPLPYPAAERLVRVSEEHPGANSPLRAPMLSNLTYHAWADAPRTVEQFAAYTNTQYTMTIGGESSRLDGARLTPSLLPLLGETPALGRFFEADEGDDGKGGVVVLTHRGWRERFNSDPSIVGRGVTIDDQPYTIVGVARPGFSLPPGDVMLWTALAVRQPAPDAVAGRRGTMNVFFAVARLRPGVTPAQAEAEGTAAARTTVRPMAANLLFGVGGPPVVHVRGLVDEMTARVRPALLVLAGAVVCLLLIACANVANLFLSRGLARQRELTGTGGDWREPRPPRPSASDRECSALRNRRRPRAGARAGDRPHRPGGSGRGRRARRPSARA